MNASSYTKAEFISAIAAKRQNGGTRLIGGDFNMRAEEAVNLITCGVVHAAGTPTCYTRHKATEIDYFVASCCWGQHLTNQRCTTAHYAHHTGLSQSK